MSDLTGRIRALIAERGPLSFAGYMELALYDPADGFFSGASVGRAGHFVTSPHVSAVFARVLARGVERVLSSLSDDALVVDLGGGEGVLAVGLREALGRPVIVVERSVNARERAAARGLEVRASLDELEPFEGVIVANELLDNVPFHRLRPGPVEVFVDADGDGLVELEGEPSIDTPDRTDGEWTVAPAISAVMRSVSSTLQAGAALFIDYGYVAGELPEPVRGYRDQRLLTDVLDRPGSADITGPVDFDAAAAAARAEGLSVEISTQRELLMGFGFSSALRDLRRTQAELEGEGRWREAIATFGVRNEAAMLVDRAGLGGHKVLIASTPGTSVWPLSGA